MNKKVILIGLCIVLVLFSIYTIFSPKGNDDLKNITVVVNHLNSPSKTFEVQTEEEYLRGALESQGLISGSESEYGLWVEVVDGEKADEAQFEWWGYDVNGQFATYGVDEQVVTDGDVYEFTLNVGY